MLEFEALCVDSDIFYNVFEAIIAQVTFVTNPAMVIC